MIVKQFHNKTNKNEIFINSPIGIIKIVCNDSSVSSLEIVEQTSVQCKKNENHFLGDALCLKVVQQLHEYFSGTRTQFNLPVTLNGSKLQIAVTNYLCTIPYGKTVSYSQVAESIGCKGVRAVATAVGQNPVPIIVPCHRVIRKDGTIGEFSLVGPELKTYLLKLEKTIN